MKQAVSEGRLCLGIAIALLSGCGAFAADLRSCRASFDGQELTITNAHIERKWRVSNGLLYPTSLRDLDRGVEWLSRPSVQPAPYPAIVMGEEKREVKFSKRAGKLGPVEAESLVAELTIAGLAPLHYRFQVFPDAGGISVQLTTAEGDSSLAAKRQNSGAATSTGIESDRPAERREPKYIADALEILDLAPEHLKLTQVRLVDQTDVFNELVFESEWLLHTAERVQLPGNLFVVESTPDQSGLILLKEAPLPHARPVKTAPDFSYDPQNRRVSFIGQGTGPQGGSGYRFVLLTYSGGRAGRIAALQTYQRQLRAYDPKRDAMLVSNTWGDRSRDARINEEFVTKEVLAGARLGVDVIQIDDGWERGRTSNSVRANGVWSGFWAADPQFWAVDPDRFPNGLESIRKLAAERGMRFGLWFGPDSSNDFANWRKDADQVMKLHRTLGVDYIKIDGVKAVSKAGEQNLRRFFDQVLEESRGAVTFDLDVTAEVRPGYFGMINPGPLFVENRYTDWHRYWPHQTLRNLWKLAQYVDPLRLRMEFLNNTRNQQLYPEDPLAPARYSPSYLFATVMFSNPLGWFETSNLPAAFVEELQPLIAKWRRERPFLFAGSIIPVGNAPDGVSWTGFVSVSPDRRSGYALLFRESNQTSDWEFELPLLSPGVYQANVLGGSGSVSIDSSKLRVHIPAARQFVWVKLKKKDN